jgi:hypothetical protein
MTSTSPIKHTQLIGTASAPPYALPKETRGPWVKLRLCGIARAEADGRSEEKPQES